jgi:cytidylate kinase
VTVIAMPREMATLGKDVALGVAKELGLQVVHRELVERDIAERMDVNRSTVHQFLEGTPRLWDRWKLDPKKLYRQTAQEMLELAEKGNVLIRGWGAVSLLRSVPHVLCIRVCAPMDFRIKVLMERLDLDSEEVARNEIVKNDKAHERSASLRNVSGWTNATNFDLVLNTERVPVAHCVEQIKQLAASNAFSETLKSAQVLSDMLTKTRIRNALSLKEDVEILDRDPNHYLRPIRRPTRRTS